MPVWGLTFRDAHGAFAAVPLVSVDVDVKIVDFLSHVTLCQRYLSMEKNPVKAVFRFPMSASAAVNRLVVTVGDRVVEGRVMEKSEARAKYDSAVRAGAGAYLVDESAESRDVFVASGEWKDGARCATLRRCVCDMMCARRCMLQWGTCSAARPWRCACRM
jgi:hypothetical protein